MDDWNVELFLFPFPRVASVCILPIHGTGTYKWGLCRVLPFVYGCYEDFGKVFDILNSRVYVFGCNSYFYTFVNK